MEIKKNLILLFLFLPLCWADTPPPPYSSSNIPNYLVKRDGSGNFAAGNITADLTGNASTATQLFTAPTNCSVHQFANAINTFADLTCSAISSADLPPLAYVSEVDTGSGLTGGPITSTGTVSCNTSGASTFGCLTSTDWSIFNGKQNALTFGNLTDTGTDGINIGGGTGAVIGSGASISQHVSDSTHNGYLDSTDWSTFNGKQSALTFGNFTDSGTDGIVVTNGAGSVIGSGTSISQNVATAIQNGYLSSTDWSTFNGKQAAGNYITALTGDVTASGPGSVASTLATVNANVGSFGDATHVGSFTVNGKGLVTAASSTAISFPSYDTTYFKQNGNSFGATAVLGTNDNNKLQFKTNGSIGVTIDTSGQVGIGTASPSSALDVHTGPITISANALPIVGTLPAGAGNVNMVLVDASSNLSLGDFSGYGAIKFFPGNSTQAMTMLSNDNVGIGQGTPTAILHLKAGTATAGTAPLKLASGTNLTTPEDGAMEYDGTKLWFTVGSTRNQIAPGNSITALTGDVTASGPGSVAATLATVNANTGSFGSSTAIPNFTVNGKGLITAAGTNVVIAPAGTLTGATLASGVHASSLTSLGTLSSLTTDFISTNGGQETGNQLRSDFTFTADNVSTHTNVASLAFAQPDSGHTVSQIYAENVTSQMNGAGNATDIVGVQVQVGNNSGSTSGTITRAAGFQVVPQFGKATITNFYGLRIKPSTGSTGSIGTLYGIYQEESTALNYFNGAVTIGTSSPDTGRLLDVNGQTGFRGLSVWSSSGTTSGVIGPGDLIASGGTASQLGVAGLSDLLFLSNGTGSAAKMILKSSGFFGVGTTSPGDLVDVSSTVAADGSTPTALRISGLLNSNLWTAGAAVANLDFYNNDLGSGGAGVRTRLSTVTEDNLGNNWALTFLTSASNAAVTEKMRIASTGRVGIGVTSPTADLHLKAGTATASTAPLKFTSGTLLTAAEAGAAEYDGTSFYLTDGTPTRKGVIQNGGNTFGAAVTIGSNDNNVLTFQTNGSEAARIDTSGFFVVGTTTAVAQIEAAGAVSDSSWTTNGKKLTISTNTLTDNSSTAGTTIGTRVAASVSRPTYAATNAITVTNAATVYIGGEPAAGTNVTITNPIALEVVRGVTYLNGNTGMGTPAPDSQLEVDGTLHLGTAGTIFTNMGTCTVASTAWTTAVTTSKTCTGVPASSAYVFCSGATAVTGQAFNAIATGANTISVVASAAGTSALRCMFITP